MARKSFLRLTRLEERSVPAVFGSPWSDARHLTLSFVPDGTLVDGVGSTLFQTLPGQPSAWQTEVLRAVQTWAANANINVDVVADGGQALGIPGAMQGDVRFGDIRLSARPLSDNVLAITTPSGVLGGTRTGDIVLNSTKPFAVGGVGGHDLYSVILQEAGHALGIGNSADPASPMYETYGGVRTGLTAGDVASIQMLYGARAKDALEGGTESLAAAVELRRSPGSQANATVVAVGDLTAVSDVDYYKVKTLSSNPNGLTFTLNAGLSLLAPKMTVYGPDGSELATVQSVNPQTGELSVALSGVQSNAYYAVKVEDANAAWGVGAYQLRAVFDPNAPDVLAEGTVERVDDAHTDDTLGSALKLSTAHGYTKNTHYSALGVLRDATDVDVYRVKPPRAGSNQQIVLTVNVRALDPAALDPTIQIYDHSKRLVSAQVLVNDSGSYVVQLASNPCNSDDDDGNHYYLLVKADAPGGVGDYHLDVDFRAQVVNLQDFAGGTLTAAAPKAYKTLAVARSQMMHFALSAADVGATEAGVRVVIFNTQGQAVATLFAKDGQTISASTYLAAGTYTVRVEGLNRAGGALPGLAYTLKGASLSDPIAPTPADPNATVANDYTWSQLESDYYASLGLTDPSGDVVW